MSFLTYFVQDLTFSPRKRVSIFRLYCYIFLGSKIKLEAYLLHNSGIKNVISSSSVILPTELLDWTLRLIWNHTVHLTDLIFMANQTQHDYLEIFIIHWQNSRYTVTIIEMTRLLNGAINERPIHNPLTLNLHCIFRLI